MKRWLVVSASAFGAMAIVADVVLNAAPGLADKVYEATYRDRFSAQYAAGCREGMTDAGYPDRRGDEFCSCVVAFVRTLTFTEATRSLFDQSVVAGASQAKACAREFLGA